ncbi:MAG: alanine--glyoxylate aminotransferase family protein [Candidatus Acidiferrales bacterium]
MADATTKLSSRPYRLRLPGPTAVPERVRDAMAQPVVNHRGPEFHAIYARVQELLKPIFGTSNEIFLFASSGTGAMEASLANVLAPGERVLVTVNGQFGEHFAKIAKALGAAVDVIETPWGEAINPGEIAEKVRAIDYRALVVVHNESSTGITADLAAMGKILGDTPTLLIADSVSGIGGLEMKQDAWGVDIVASASQKALMCPPGIGLASVSAKAWKIVERENGVPRFFWDFRKAKAAAEKSETAFTSPVSLIAGLREALEMIHEEGLTQVLKRHKQLSAALRAGCAALGLNEFGKAASLSPTVVALEVPEKINGGDIVRRLYERFGTVIAGSRNKLSGRVIRIGTMGNVHEEDILTDLAELEEVLNELGWKAAKGAGVSAAATILRD